MPCGLSPEKQWIGVTFYLTREAVDSTLRDIAAIAPAGSSIVFDYMDGNTFIPDGAPTRIRKTQEMVRNVGDPLITGFDPSTLAVDPAALGLKLKQDLGPSDFKIATLVGAPGAMARSSMSVLPGRRSHSFD